MLYVRLCFDKPGAGALRDLHRAEHRLYLRSSKTVKLIQGGPLCIGDHDDTNIASFMILEAGDISDVVDYHAHDPFTLAGIFDEIRIHRWDKHVG
jgi:uncharacterized protein YciI